VNNNKQGNNSDIFAFLAVFITVVVIGYLYLSSQYAIYHRDKVQSFFLDKPEETTQEISTDSIFDSSGQLKNAPVHKYKRRIEKVTEKKGIPLNIENRKKQQKQLLKRFSSLLSIKANYPEDLHYRQLDLDDKITGIMGTGGGQIKTLTILATRMTVSTTQVADFLSEENNGVPSVRNLKFSRKALREVSSSSHSGLGKVTILRSINSKSIYAALVPRKDRQGTYLFILESNPDFFDNNEGYVDKLFSSLKAL
jgi:hypothetical protein